MTTKKDDKSSWAIGGTIIIGVGVGFFFLPSSPLLFVASILDRFRHRPCTGANNFV